MIPEFVPYFGETLTEKDLLGRKGKKMKTGKEKKKKGKEKGK